MERMERQLTAVDSLIKIILPFIDRSKVSDMMLQDIVSEHLSMEKEQIKDALQGFLDITLPDKVCEQYYKKPLNQNK